MDIKIKKIQEVGDLKGKKVFLRLDFNVPISSEKKIANDFRIKKSFPTLDFLRKSGAKVILASHIESSQTDSLEPVFEYLKGYFPLKFVKDYFSNESDQVFERMSEGDVVLLENLRQHPGEKSNDEDFSKKLSSLADIYVNNAFASSHREHASIVGIPKFIPGYTGLLFQTEIENLSKSFHPDSPSVFILGGAKFDTKLPLIKRSLEVYDKVFVGGALAHNFYLEKGYEIGSSISSPGDFNLPEIMENPKVILPKDIVIRNEKGEVINKKPDEVEKGETILDAGSETLEGLKKLVRESKFVLWNGPLGNYEKGFDQTTFDLAEAVSESNAESIVGGGDTLAAISSLGIEDKFSFVSTGGGAMLDFLANETIPGIEALNRE